MCNTLPGTSIEVLNLEKGCSKSLFDGIFAAGGITLSQVCVMAGVEPYLVQNWVKRGFVSSPRKRLYSRDQFSRIIIINMLRESIQIDKICGLIRIIRGLPDDESDDLISDEELYHRYVDMLTENINTADPDSVLLAAERATEDFSNSQPHAKKQLCGILQVMLYAHSAASLRRSAENALAALR